MYHHEDAFDKFDEISVLVKQTNLKFKDPKVDADLRQSPAAAQAVTERQKWVQSSKNLLSDVNDLVSAADRKLLTKDKTFTIPNLKEQADMLEWGGVSFGEENTLKL